MARPWKTLDRVETDEGPVELRQRGERDFLITVAGRPLMTSTATRSELEVARAACADLANTRAPRVLIGGLGMGFTLRMALDVLPASASVTVAELTERIGAWCEGPLAPLTDNAVKDPRVRLQFRDVAEVIRRTSPDRRWHAIVLDLYEGPNAATQKDNDPLYGVDALTATRRALVEGGVLSVWSEDPDKAFETRLRRLGFDFRLTRPGKGGRRHAVYVARRSR